MDDLEKIIGHLFYATLQNNWKKTDISQISYETQIERTCAFLFELYVNKI